MSRPMTIAKELDCLNQRIDRIQNTVKRARECVDKGDVPRAHALVQFRIKEKIADIEKNIERAMEAFGDFFRDSKDIEEAEAEIPDEIETVPRAPAEQGREGDSPAEPPQPTFLPLFALRFKNGIAIEDSVLCGLCKTKGSEKHTREHTLKHHQGEWDRGAFTEANGEGLNCSVCGRDNKQEIAK